MDYEPTKYARLFDETCPAWENDQELNKMYMERMQDYVDAVLKHRGYIFLRDIYEKLGLWVSKDSITAGYHKTDTEHVGMKIILSDEKEQAHVIVDFENVNEDITKYFFNGN